MVVQGLPQVFVLLSDPILENVYRHELESSHYCTVWCEKGEGWKESLLRFKYDVILADLSLHSSSPLEWLVALRKLAPESAVVALSDSNDARLAVAAYKNGVTDYFFKPVNPETLRWHLEKIVRKKRLYSSSEVLNADLQVFSAVHQLHQSEDDKQMRSLALRHLASILDSNQAIWFWPDRLTPPEWLPGSEPLLTSFEQLASSESLRKTFDQGVTAHPQLWAQKDYIWIPLRDAKLGGIFLDGKRQDPNPASLARAEFLVRNLEIALENQQRYLDIKQLTYIDDLTGLYNSRYLEIAVAAATKAQGKFSVLFIDIDRFKSVNDTHGHLVGSQLLTELAGLLKLRLRRPDLLFRYGGDEFIALLYGLDGKKATEAAERLRMEVEKKRFFLFNKELNITLSIGIASFPDHGHDKKEILEMADQAMYSSKQQGRNRVFLAPVLEERKAA